MNTDSNNNDEKRKQKTRVKVAIRVRPMIPKQLLNGENTCVQFPSDSQIILGSDKHYKFDHVFKDSSHQSEVYEGCVKQLVMSCFEGYNAAILAYGQTGSGKTFTMGTSASTLSNPSQIGIIPRVINEIYKTIEQKKQKIQFRVKASFLEIYNEQIKDLLLLQNGIKTNKNKDNGISIREEKDGSVSIYGLMQEETHSPQQMIALLQRGGYNRTTGATLMNDASSRSHAIFTIFIQQHVIEDLYKSDKGNNQINNEEGYMTAKFFFVDLAGSERAKKTGATGATLKEGININLGLLELGNVISALSTIQKKHDQFITYRNSKLTRILQDCLGGNSNTYMIACVSPAESNFQESLNTLKYASKAMNIKNKPIVNRDPQSALISQLKQKIFELQVENRKLKHILSKDGADSGLLDGLELGSSSISDDEVTKQLQDAKKLVSQLQKKHESLQLQHQQHKRKVNELQIINYELRRKNDFYQLTLQQIQTQHPEIHIKMMQLLQEQQNNSKMENKSILQRYQQQIQSLQRELEDKDKLYSQIEKELEKMEKNSKNDEQILIKKNKQIYQLSKEISTLQILLNQRMREEPKATEQTTEITIQQEQSNEISAIQDTQQLQSEFLGHDNQLETHRQTLEKSEQTTNGQIEQIQSYIKEKQSYLQQMTKKQINMEYQLISEMKEQYHQKIMLLEKQKKLLTKQKDESISGNQKTKFVTKIDTLEHQLKEYRKKIKEQKNIEKQLTSQNCQIKQLAEQIKKFKFQKLQLSRKLKEDKDSFNKLKNQRIKQLLHAKKQSMKKDSMLKKVQMDNQKKTLQFRKKDEEVKRVRRVNETLKNLIRQPHPPLDVRNMIKKQGQNIPSSKALKKHSNSSSNNNQSQMSMINNEHVIGQKQATELLRSILNRLTRQIDHQKTQLKYSQKIISLQKQIDVLMNDQATFKLKYQKLNLIPKEQRTEEDLTHISQLQISLSDINQRLSSLDDSVKFIRDKQMQMISQQIHYFDMELQVIYNKQLTQHVDNVRIFYSSVFEILKNLLQDNYMLIETKQQNQSQINQLNLNIQEMRENMIQINHQHQNNLAKLREEMLERCYNNQVDEQDFNGSGIRKVEEKDKKILERKILDLTKSNSKLCQQVEMWKRKCSIVQEKYHNMKNLTSKDKNIGRQQQQLSQQPIQQCKDESKQKRLQKNQHMLDEVNDMLEQFDRLDKVKRHTSNIQENEKERERKEEKENDGLDYSVSKWECLGKIEAHNSAILSMAAHANILISTGTKSLKIWDLETSKIISDLSGPHLSGFVEYVMVDPQRRLMFTACEKNVTIWDLVTLNVEGTLKAHKDKVKTIHIHNDLLFTGGKGLPNSGSLLAWDLRNLNPNHPMEQKQRNQDIFSFTSKNNILYYGTRNHHVRRMNMTNMEILSPFEPPHMDAVTSLAIVKDRLISGSRDKNLRLWNIDQTVNNSKHTFPVFNDFVTSCQSDKQLPIFYAGSKDGQIKVGGIKNDKIQLVGGILAHTQSVNAICPLQQNGNIIVTASADKTIKLWQPTQETIQVINHEFR